MRVPVLLITIGLLCCCHAWTGKLMAVPPPAASASAPLTFPDGAYQPAAVQGLSRDAGHAASTGTTAVHSCGAECAFCWVATPWEGRCPLKWEQDGRCDCGCQFADTDDCFGPLRPDLIVQDSSREPATDVTPGQAVSLTDTVANTGEGPAAVGFRVMWYISTDDSVTSADLAWGFRYVACCMEPGATSSVTGSLLWPDVPPYNTPGETYYIAIVADDRNQLVESDEDNNAGKVWMVTLAERTGGRGDGAGPNATPVARPPNPEPDLGAIERGKASPKPRPRSARK